MSERSVKDIEHKVGHIQEIEFSDGRKRNVDFASFSFYCGHHDYEKYQEIGKLLEFEIIEGNLNLGDHTMIFPVEDLYQNRLIK
ncbi:hypothetical protein EZJ19_15190 [Parasulfuritortus cantonensis]|uniref:Uncharacterized protein n=1 Tax=Parasulfuritortus cantonensis TaxID=2528202 RepID=A0A4R1B0W3_9PROT|nr:hypothetical protein EZJ19_15190 [Parasulfuritortus cantonensis]